MSSPLKPSNKSKILKKTKILSTKSMCCSVCLLPMIKINVCVNGHSTCHTCAIMLKLCPQCKEPILLMRNTFLEHFIKSVLELKDPEPPEEKFTLEGCPSGDWCAKRKVPCHLPSCELLVCPLDLLKHMYESHDENEVLRMKLDCNEERKCMFVLDFKDLEENKSKLLLRGYKVILCKLRVYRLDYFHLAEKMYFAFSHRNKEDLGLSHRDIQDMDPYKTLILEFKRTDVDNNKVEFEDDDKENNKNTVNSSSVEKHDVTSVDDENATGVDTDNTIVVEFDELNKVDQDKIYCNLEKLTVKRLMDNGDCYVPVDANKVMEYIQDNKVLLSVILL